MKNNRFVIYFRRGLLALFVVLITAAAYLHQVGGAMIPSIHALCPFGGLESLFTLLTAGTFIDKVFSGTMILFFITLLVAVVFRKSFCGILCPFGAIQEFFALLGKKIFRRNFTVPRTLDQPLRYLKYLVLVITVSYAWKTAGLWMAPYDPWAAYAHLSEGIPAVWASSSVGLILLFTTVAGSTVYDRFFCKYLCPMGALNGIIGKISPFKVVRNEEACIHCDLCSINCPANIDVSHGKGITSAECFNCQTCVLNCPAAGALELKAGRKTVKPMVAILLVLALFFLPIFVTQSLGVYRMTPEKIKAGQTVGIAEVRGYMTIREASEATKMELTAFYQKFQIPEGVPPDTKMKEIGGKAPGYDFHKVKDALK
jgi:NAD-dependent dihydropyrimidine dehydrogenase PreA subunit